MKIEIDMEMAKRLKLCAGVLDVIMMMDGYTQPEIRETIERLDRLIRAAEGPVGESPEREEA